MKIDDTHSKIEVEILKAQAELQDSIKDLMDSDCLSVAIDQPTLKIKNQLNLNFLSNPYDPLWQSRLDRNS